MIEKRFYAVPPQAFTANGTVDGVITIAANACSLFKVKQVVILSATGLPNLKLEIKEIDSNENIQVGPIPNGSPGVNTSITARTDISAYTVALNATISANEQKRPAIDYAEVIRATYDEEPTVAARSILVDECGNRINQANPLPVAIDSAIEIGDVSIVDGSNTMGVNNDGSINVNVVNSTPANTPGLNIQYNEVTSVAAGVETTLITLVAPPTNYRISRIEVSGTNVATFRVKLNGTTLSLKRTWWTQFNSFFDYEPYTEGLLVTNSNTLTVTVLHNSPTVGDFEVTVFIQ